MPPTIDDLHFFQFFDLPVTVEESLYCEKAIVGDKAGFKWLDLSVGGIGYNHPDVLDAARQQIQELPLSSRVFFNRNLAQFVKEIASVLPSSPNIVYPCNSPSEAIEGALKLARGYHPRRQYVISFEGSYHGNTWGAMSVCGIEKIRNTVNQFPFPVKFLSFGDIQQLTKTNLFHSSCVILEPISSLSSAINTDIEPYIRLLKKKCTESKTLLIVNENFTSLGNCGAWTWCEAVRLEPDILVLGNVLGAGLLPTGLYSARQNINNTVYGREHPALHGGTTAGNPLMCSIGIAVLNIIARENLILRTTTLIAIIKTFINNISEFNIKIFQIGIIMSLRFPTATFTERIRKDCYKNKVLLGILHGNELSILINPPLLISHSDLERGLFVLYLAIKNTMKIYISQPNYDTF